MTSRQDIEEHSAAIADAVDEAQLSLQEAVTSMSVANLTTPDATDQVTQPLAAIIETWGEVAATISADYYERMREKSGAAGSFAAIIPDTVNVEQVRGLTAWHLHQWLQTIDGAPTPADLERLPASMAGTVQRLVRQAGRDTIVASTERDPGRPRVARVPMGAETCAFCLVLASRGPVYRTLDSAGEGRDFHDFDDCEQVIVWTADDELPEGYDEGELYGFYEAARREAGSGDLKKILATLRTQLGIR